MSTKAADAIEHPDALKKDFDHCESVYWVFTQRCNDACDHCYNRSGPPGATISLADCLAIVEHLPARCDRVILSGGQGFLGGTELPQEISIQFWKINPCCPGTRHPIGDARADRVADVLRRVSKLRPFRQINAGNPYAMGESVGVSEAAGRARADEVQNVCFWCDEFFERYVDPETLELRAEPRPPSGIEHPLPVIGQEGS